MPVAGEIVESSGRDWRGVEVYPFNDDGFTRVRAIAVEEFDRNSPTLTSVKRHVSWPSLAGKSPAEARAFGHAILAAAAWTEKTELEKNDGD